MTTTLLLSAIIVFLLAYIIYVRRKNREEIREYVESIHYKDFSRKHPHFQPITDAFLKLSQEKEAQQHYLMKILELVDTGILAYDIDTLEILWVNEACLTMLNIPHLKNLNWLKRKDEKLFNELILIPTDEHNLLTIHALKQTIETLTNAVFFETEGKRFKLIAFHNVGTTIEEVESSAWKGLLNVMTHEIMNSIVPVSSLSDTLKKKVLSLKMNSSLTSASNWEDLEVALDTIHRRSDGLLRFAETYRNLSQKIIPNQHQCNLYDLLHSVHTLMLPTMQQKGIKFTLQTNQPDVTSLIDKDLIEQVVINLVTNAMFALKEHKDPEINLFSGCDNEKHPYLTVVDNGCGISPEIRNKIFIPFFTTKKNGNGIGLCISREIIKAHRAKLHIQSKENIGSAFTILFQSSSQTEY